MTSRREDSADFGEVFPTASPVQTNTNSAGSLTTERANEFLHQQAETSDDLLSAAWSQGGHPEAFLPPVQAAHRHEDRDAEQNSHNGDAASPGDSEVVHTTESERRSPSEANDDGSQAHDSDRSRKKDSLSLFQLLQDAGPVPCFPVPVNEQQHQTPVQAGQSSSGIAVEGAISVDEPSTISTAVDSPGPPREQITSSTEMCVRTRQQGIIYTLL